jgi:hypothetical protein
MKTTRSIVAFALALACLCSSAGAAVFVGSSADITDFANGSEVPTNGTLIDAVNLLNDNVDGVGVSTTINGVLFKGTQPGAFHEGAEDFANASFVYHGGDNAAGTFLWNSGGAYETLARSQIYNVDNGTVNYGDGFGVVNLQPGQLYELQIFMLDDRSDINKTFPLQFQMIQFTGEADQFVPVPEPDQAAAELGFISGITIGGNGSTQANGEIATVTFSIDAPFNGIFVNSWDGGAYNGMQLRSVSLSGDLDTDNDVDGNDFLVWQRGLGSEYGPEDLEAIRAQFGISLNAPGVSAIPEPCSAALALLAGVALCNCSGRRRRSNRSR